MPSAKSTSALSSDHSHHSETPGTPHRADERSPLLARSNGVNYANDNDEDRTEAESPADSLNERDDSKSRPRCVRWPSILALLTLCVAILIILMIAFVIPRAVEEYVKQAVVVEPTRLRITEIASWGVLAHVQANFKMDGSRVRRKGIRDLGRFGTWIAREVESGETVITVTAPQYGDAELGSALVPGFKVNVRNGHTTPLDFTTTLKLGSDEAITRIADDWLASKVDQLKIHGQASIPVKSGILSLGVQSISQNIVMSSHNLPTMPQYNISDVNFREKDTPDGSSVLTAEVGLQVENIYPFDFTIPPLGFAILVSNCDPADPRIIVADATTTSIHVRPNEDLSLNVTGVVRHLPDALITSCPDSHQSPLDLLLGDYIHGKPSIIYVRGSDSPSLDTPRWITDIISGITVPVPFPGHAFGRLIKRFSLENVRFSFPDAEAEPGTPEANPQISAKIKALVALPQEMKFSIDVHRIRASADVFFRGKKLGFLDLREWQNATSSPTVIDQNGQRGLEVNSAIEDAPLQIEDEEVFSDVIQTLIKSRQVINLTVKAAVDVELKTSLGVFVVRKIPGEGIVPIKPIRGGSLESFAPKIYNLEISATDAKSLTLESIINFTNPTEYSAKVPFMDIHILVNGSLLGHATAQNINVVPGNNTNLAIQAIWQPFFFSGDKGVAVGRELLSEYISGYNTTLTLKAHNGTIPSQPFLGHALDFLEVELPTPKLGNHDDAGDGGDGDDENQAPHFIKDATMHLFSSTAVFTLMSPLRHSTIYITHINATAFHDGEAVGKILYDGSLAVPPGESTSPRLPVQWNLDSLGYQDVKQALGGSLKLSAKANLGVMIGRYEERIWFAGKGIGAKVRL